MSGNGEPIDLNSDVILGDRESDCRALNYSEPVINAFNDHRKAEIPSRDLGEGVRDVEQTKAESPSRELGEDDVKDFQEANSSQQGIFRLDKDVAERNVGFEAVNNEILVGISPDNVEGAEMRCDFSDAGVKIGEKSSVSINDLSKMERECSGRIHVSEKIPVVCEDEIMADDNQVVLESENGAGTLNASPSDVAFCSEVKKQVTGSLESLKEFAEGGVADATSGHHSVGNEPNVESQKGICTISNEKGEVAQDGELAFRSVDVKFDQIEKHGGSYKLLDHDDGIDTVATIEPEGLGNYNNVDDAGPHLNNLGSVDSVSTENTTQLTDDLYQKVEKLSESNELSPVVATDRKTMLALDCSEHRSMKAGGQADENEATGCYFQTTEASIDIDEANLFDVVIEMDPNVVMDNDVSDAVNVNSADSVVDFKISDLVWGKVRSHPWWPGQICDPSASSKKAMKYFKEGRYLIAFFGDHTFAWKEASMIKPFKEYFRELKQQSDLENFDHAINCALEELSRRVEFGLACSCLSKELYSELEIQTLTNAGIRKKSSRIFGGDSSLSASSFEPTKLINFVKEVARLPLAEADRLELVQAQAQLLAFNRWKGYYKLPEFNVHDVVFNNTDNLSVVENDQSELIDDTAINVEDDEVTLHGEGNLKTRSCSGGKRKRNSGNCSHPNKKRLPHILSGNHESEGNAGSMMNSHALSEKHQVVNSISNDPAVKPSVTHVSTESAYESGQTERAFRVGDRIRRVACKLNKSIPIFKNDDGISQKTAAQNEGNAKPMPNRELSHMEYPLDEIFSRLCLTAVNPMSGFDFLNAVVNFFSEFRNFICMELTNLVDQGTGNKVTMTGKRKEIPASDEASDSQFIKDSYWTDRLIQGIAEDQPYLENQNAIVDCQLQSPSENAIPSVGEQEKQFSPDTSCTAQGPHEHAELEPENRMEDVYPTALILNFTDLASVPSESNLNNIFRKYGPLYESKTEVMKKSSRAKVVFKRSSDAETAFSSAGKYSIFGPSLVSYRLKYLPPATVSPPAKRRRKQTIPQGENA